MHALFHAKRRAVLLEAALATCGVLAASAHGAYPTAPQITDKGASASFNIILSDFAIAPKSQPFPAQDARTTSQAARINFIRAEPVSSLASQRLFVPDLNASLYIFDRSTRMFSEYLNFTAIFNGAAGVGTFDSSPGFAAGLVTIQFDPDYINNGKFYTVHTELDGVNPSNFRQAVVEQWQDTNIHNTTFEGTHSELLRVQYTGNIHPVGDLLFNPLAADSSHPDWRNMYIASGDGSAGESTTTSIRNRPQRLDNFLGKVLRITPSTTGAGTYSIPADNPFVSNSLYPGARDEVYAYGFRNPHRLAWDVEPTNPSNNTLFVMDIGLHSYEELNIVLPGRNYGYSKIEGTQVLGTNNQVNDDPLPNTLPVWTSSSSTNPPPAVQSIAPTYPVAQYSHYDGDAISSGFVYRGTLIPQLVGKFVFADITTARLFYVDLDDLLAVHTSEPEPVDPSKIHELTIYYSSPFDSDGLKERRIFDITRDAFDRRNEESIPLGSTIFGPADGDRLPGGASVTNGDDPYGVPYGGGRSDIRLAIIDDEIYVISKSDGMIRALTTALGGDTNLDGFVDETDLGALASNWQHSAMWKGGDFDHDGFVDIDDLKILATNWELTGGSAQSLSTALTGFNLPAISVPEPRSLIALTCLLLLTRTTRRDMRLGPLHLP